MFLKVISFLMLALASSGSLSATTYYVAKNGSDQNNGSAGAPWLTIQKAASSAVAGDTVNIASGTYSGSLTFSKSGSGVSPIIFIGSDVIQAGNVTFSGSYVIVSGLTVSPPSAGIYNAITINGSNNTLTNCTVANYGASASDQATAIGLGGSYNSVINCVIRDLNDIDAFHVFGHDQTILGCTVTNLQQVNYSLNHTDCIQSWNSGSSSYNILIKNCKFVNSACQAGNTETDGSASLHDWTFENCVFANIAQPFFCGITRTKFCNCVFYKACNNSGSSEPVIFYGIANYDSTGSGMINCVLLQCGPNPSNGSQGGIGANGVLLSSLQIDHNYIAGTSYAAKSGAYIGSNAINGGNPKFVNEAGFDFHLLSGSILIGTGANLATIFNDDLDGKTRPNSGAWDIGAYQFGSVTNDNPTIAVSDITINASDIAPGTIGMQVYGGSVVQLSAIATNASSYQWSYTVNGGSPVVYQAGSGAVLPANFTYGTNTIGNTYIWTIMASNDTATAESHLTMSVVAPPTVAAGLLFASQSGIISGIFVNGSTVINGITYDYIYQPIQTLVATAGGSAIYDFTITNAGNYVIQALVNAPTSGANSLFVSIDGQPQDPTMIWDVTLTSGFEQRLISWRGNGTDSANQFVPNIFTLTSGAHQIIIRGREPNTQLSSFSILQVPQPPSGLHVM